MPLPATAIHPTMQTAAVPGFPNGSLHAGVYTLIFRIRHRQSRELLKQCSLILMPQQFSQETEARTALYYTKGGIVADTPLETGVGATYFSISGHTGYGGIINETPLRPGNRLPGLLGGEAFLQTVENQFQAVQSLVTTFGAPLGRAQPIRTSLIDGAAAVKDLQDTMLAYFFPQGRAETRDVTQTHDLQLEFLNLTAPTSQTDPVGQVGWVIHPHRNLVSLRQDATRPFLYFYTLHFAGIADLAVTVDDLFVEQYTEPKQGLLHTLDDITKIVRATANGVNTIVDAFQQLVITNVTGPINTFLTESQRLGDAVGNFMTGVASKIAFPLYAQRQFLHVLDAPRHSVSTLKQAAKDLAQFLIEGADPRSLGRLFAGTNTSADLDDALTLRLNGEDPQTVRLGTQTSGHGLAQQLQQQVRGLTPQHAANASAYRDFTATYDPATGQYALRSGTKASNAGAVQVVTPEVPLLAATDASGVLGLGVANGGQEYPGSAYPNAALALLRGMERACTHLLAFPDYFADQLDAQDAVLSQFVPPHVSRPHLRGDQRLTQTRITPGDSLQGIANRVGVDWQTLALVNQLAYPFVLEQPTTLQRGRVSAADVWSLTDVVQTWPVDTWQGQRVDIVAGPGAGQSRRIVRSTATLLWLETAWDVVPNDTSDYAIRRAENPLLRTGVVTSATARSLTDSTVTLVPGSQRGLTILLTSGDTFGARGRVSGNDTTTLTMEQPWIVPPLPGTSYAVVGSEPATYRHQRLVGEWLSVPQPSAQTPLPLRTRLQDTSAITGRLVPLEEQLFGRDLRLQDGVLVWDTSLADAVTIAALPNLRQALIHLVNLPIGELEYQPGLGSYVQEELGLVATLPLEIQVLQSVQRTIKQDARVASMESAALFAQGGQTLITFGARAINGASMAQVVIR